MAEGEFQDSDAVRVLVMYSEALAHLIYAGADVVVVPSIFEPCGLTQLVAMRYGALPLVRRTGGLADTVKDQGRTTPSSLDIYENLALLQGTIHVGCKEDSSTCHLARSVGYSHYLLELLLLLHTASVYPYSCRVLKDEISSTGKRTNRSAAQPNHWVMPRVGEIAIIISYNMPDPILGGWLLSMPKQLARGCYIALDHSSRTGKQRRRDVARRTLRTGL